MIFKIATWLTLSGMAAFMASGVPAAISSSKAPTPALEEVAALKAAIIGVESNGDPNAINEHSRALGLGQIRPANIPSWSKAALGKEISEREFLARPDLQHKIIEHRLSEYLQIARTETPTEDEAVRYVAAKWYSGQGKLKDSNKPQFYSRHPYPSIAEYADRALQKYRQYKP